MPRRSGPQLKRVKEEPQSEESATKKVKQETSTDSSSAPLQAASVPAVSAAAPSSNSTTAVPLPVYVVQCAVLPQTPIDGQLDVDDRPRHNVVGVFSTARAANRAAITELMDCGYVEEDWGTEIVCNESGPERLLSVAMFLEDDEEERYSNVYVSVHKLNVDHPPFEIGVEDEDYEETLALLKRK